MQGVHELLYKTPAHLKSHSDDSGAFFGTLGFTVPIEELTLRTAAVADVLTWLTKPKGPRLVDAGSIVDSKAVLAILMAPEALYDPDSPQVGLGVVYKAPYIQMTMFAEAFFFLKSASRPKVSTRITQA